jgi:hypothetical protein
MSYFIFLKNSDNINNTLYRIAENQSDLNNLNIDQNYYKIIEDSQINFDSVKYGQKSVEKYNNDIISYLDISYEYLFINKNQLSDYIQNVVVIIKQYLNNNLNHPLFNRWNDYCNQLQSLNLDSITFPLNKSLEQYFKDQNLTSLSPLQIP